MITQGAPYGRYIASDCSVDQTLRKAHQGKRYHVSSLLLSSLQSSHACQPKFVVSEHFSVDCHSFGRWRERTTENETVHTLGFPKRGRSRLHMTSEAAKTKEGQTKTKLIKMILAWQRDGDKAKTTKTSAQFTTTNLTVPPPTKDR
jgi:hypothetical protein